MARFVLVDFETLGAADLKRCGAWRYAEDLSTEVACMGYTIDGELKGLWKPGDRGHDELFAAMRDPACLFIAFNTGFEKAIWRNIMVPVHGWPDIPNERWHDPQSVCAMKGLPLKLERVLPILGLGAKDTEGTKAVLTLSRFDKHGRMGGDPATREERLQRTYKYCMSDIDTELSLHRRIKSLGKDERKVWLLDQTINERGVRLDLDFVDAAQSICEQAAGPLTREFKELTGLKPTQRDAFFKWLNDRGANLPDLKKETIEKFLGADDDEEPEEDSLAGDDVEAQLDLGFSFRRPLEIRRILGSASIKKLARMRACVGVDGRARGLLQYHGAGPGRWAGRLLQPQNFPRPTLKVGGKGHDAEQLTDAIKTGDAEYLRVLFGEPIEAVASGLRHAIVAGESDELVVGDFATIEARIVCALAGAHKAVEAFADPEQDVYCSMAGSIYGVPAPSGKDNVKQWKLVHPEKRDIGKKTVLGCGFQMGKNKFRARYAKDHPIEFAAKCVAAYREDFAPEVPRLWYGLERAAVRCVWDGAPQEYAGVEYRLEDWFLTARLPSGRKLWYNFPRPVKKAMPWDPDDIRPGFEYKANKMGRWITVSAYGGLLTENVVQALARDLLVRAMFLCEDNLLPLVLTVHDEAVAECRPVSGVSNWKLMEELMCDRPAWAKAINLPINAECWSGPRYKK